MQEDTDRLDWLQEEFYPLEIDVYPERCFITHDTIDGMVRYSGPTVRAAIDKMRFGGRPDKIPNPRAHTEGSKRATRDFMEFLERRFHDTN